MARPQAFGAQQTAVLTWAVSRMTLGSMDAWAETDANFARMIGWTGAAVRLGRSFPRSGHFAERMVRFMLARNLPRYFKASMTA